MQQHVSSFSQSYSRIQIGLSFYTADTGNITLSSTSFTPNGTLYSPAGEWLASFDAYSGSSITYTATVPGEYSLIVSGTTGTESGPFTVTIE